LAAPGGLTTRETQHGGPFRQRATTRCRRCSRAVRPAGVSARDAGDYPAGCAAEEGLVMLTRTLRALAALGLVTASGCWLQTGFDAQRTGANGGETTITSATVGDLAAAWSVPVG